MIPFLLAALALGPEKPVTISPRLLTTRVAPQTPRLLPNGDGFLVAWNQGAAMAHVNSEGEVLDRPSLQGMVPPNVRFFDFIRHGDAFVFSWYYFVDPGIVHIRAAMTGTTLFDIALPDADINSYLCAKERVGRDSGADGADIPRLRPHAHFSANPLGGDRWVKFPRFAGFFRRSSDERGRYIGYGAASIHRE